MTFSKSKQVFSKSILIPLIKHRLNFYKPLILPLEFKLITMKNNKTIAIVLLVFLSSIFSGYAQIFTEDFEGVTAPNLPTDWITTTQGTDGGFYTGNSEDAIAGFFWIIKDHTNFAMSNDDVCMCDKSNDFLILPEQDFSTYPETSIFLQFDTWMENLWGGESMVKVDTGQGWMDVYLMEPKAEWQTRVVNLSAFAGCPTVSVAFHYNDLGQSGLGLAIDDVSIFVPEHQYDVAIYSVENIYSDYPEIPLSQLIPITHSSTVYNNGKDTLRNLQIIAQSTQTSYKDTVFVSSLAPANYFKAEFADEFIISETGLSSLNYSILHDHTDEYVSNNLQTYNFAVEDSSMAKESGTFDDAVILFDGESTAQAFTVFADDTLTSVTIKLMFAAATDQIQFYIYEYDNYYGPSIIIDSTQISFTPATGWTTYSFATDTTSGVGLAAGDYFLAMKKTGAGMTGLCATTDYYVKETTYTSHDEVFFYAFYMDEQSHGGVEGKHHTYLMRPNFGEDQSSSVGMDMLSTKNDDVLIYPNPSNGIVNISSEKEIELIQVYDVKGSLVFEIQNALNPQLDFSSKDKGIYFCRIKQDKQWLSKKILIE